MTIEIHQAALEAVLNDPNGPVAPALVQQAERFVVDAKESLSIRRPYGQGRHSGIPFLRTGNLRESIELEGPKMDDGILTVFVVSNPINAGAHYQPNYARLLLDGDANQYGPYGPFKFNSPAVDALLTY